MLSWLARYSLFCVSSVVLISLNVQAQSERAELTAKAPIESINKKFEVDPNVSDIKLRADAGSRSRYSFKFNLSYAGPPVGDLSEKDQPNPDGVVGAYATSISGTIAARLRLTEVSAINVGSGLKLIHPFHGMERTDLSNPSITYDVSQKWSGLQTRHSVGYTFRTLPEFTRVGQTSMLTYNLSGAYPLANTRLILGLDSSLGYFIYNREYQKKDGKTQLYSLLLYPSLKYRLSDKVNLETTFCVSFWSPRSKNKFSTLYNRMTSERVGVGYALAKDIYLNPFINFYVDALRLKTTTLNLALIFSVL